MIILILFKIKKMNLFEKEKKISNFISHVTLLCQTWENPFIKEWKEVKRWIYTINEQ